MAAKARAQFPLPIGKEVKVRLGDSFHQSSSSAYHKVQYDFKPASFSSRRPGSVEVGNHRDVTMSFPQSEYRGSTQPTTKDCVMIIEPDGSIVLERIWSNIRVKRQRSTSGRDGRPDGSSMYDGTDELDHPPPKRRAREGLGGEAGSDTSDGEFEGVSAVPQQHLATAGGRATGSSTGSPPSSSKQQRPMSSSGSSSDSSSSDSDSDSSSSGSGSDGGDSSDDSSSSSDSDDLADRLDQKIDQTFQAEAPAAAPATLKRQGSGNLSSDLEMSETDSD